MAQVSTYRLEGPRRALTTNKREPTPKRGPFTYHPVVIEISEVSKTRIKANCFKLFYEESQSKYL